MNSLKQETSFYQRLIMLDRDNWYLISLTSFRSSPSSCYNSTIYLLIGLFLFLILCLILVILCFEDLLLSLLEIIPHLTNYPTDLSHIALRIILTNLLIHLLPIEEERSQCFLRWLRNIPPNSRYRLR